MTKIYLVGPMRGYEHYNFPAFLEKAAALRLEGHEVVSPAEHDLQEGFDVNRTLEDQDFDLQEAFRWDIEQILKSDAIALLPGWEKSQGARIEHDVAKAVGLEIVLL